MVLNFSMTSQRPQFGNRILSDGDDVFKHNAWDNVEWNGEQEAAAKEKVSVNSEIKFSPLEIENFDNEASDHWNSFYQVHQNRFFKDRHWLFTEFAELASNSKNENLVPSKSIVHDNIEDDSDSKNTSEDKIRHQNLIEPSNDIGESKTISHTSLPTLLESSFIQLRKKEEYIGENSQFKIFEVGCGVGNTVFPVLETNQNPNLFIYCCDFSSTAIDLVKENENYDTKRCHAFVCDLAEDNLKTPFPKESLDVVVCIFVLSALSPDRIGSAIKKLATLLKPGGVLLFRDYGRYDMAQLRFKKGRCLGDNFYARGDGTRCYFFTQDELREQMRNSGLEEVQNYVDRRLQVNRGKQLTMYRVWIQAKYRKPTN